MPEVIVSDDMLRRVKEFKQVFEAVLDETIEFDAYVESLLGIALGLLLRDFQSAVDQDTLLKSFEQLAARHPAEVYGYIVETMKRGEIVQKSEEWQHRFGFHPHRPPDQGDANPA